MMVPSLQRLIDPPLLFADRSRARGAPDGTLEAARLATRLGADGILVRVRVEDAEVVLGARPRRLSRRPAPVTLDALLAGTAGPRSDILVVVDSSQEAAAAVHVGRASGALGRLWVGARTMEDLEELRLGTPATRLLHIADPTAEPRGPERHAARLREAGIDGAMVAEDRTSAGLVALMHRFGRLILATGADHPRTARRGLGHGVDALAGIDAETLVDGRDRP